VSHSFLVCKILKCSYTKGHYLQKQLYHFEYNYKMTQEICVQFFFTCKGFTICSHKRLLLFQSTDIQGRL